MYNRAPELYILCVYQRNSVCVYIYTYINDRHITCKAC